ncbi:hypothetical protein BGX34_008781 [Mortierella sp. NVP85]|nr:hypothetical protein BGX34_008781 [Mortierella sp. NVP85]
MSQSPSWILDESSDPIPSVYVPPIVRVREKTPDPRWRVSRREIEAAKQIQATNEPTGREVEAPELTQDTSGSGTLESSKLPSWTYVARGRQETHDSIEVRPYTAIRNPGQVSSSLTDACKGCTCCLILRQKLEREKERERPLDERVPVEVWEHVFRYLYPSQLSRVSRVSKTFYDIIDGLSIWHEIYIKGLSSPRQDIDFGLTTPKRLMLFVFACSFCICEHCFRFCDGENVLGRLAVMPLPVSQWRIQFTTTSSKCLISKFADMIRRFINIDECEPEIRLCLSCRRTAYEHLPESPPSDFVNRYLLKRELKVLYHLGDKSIQGIDDRRGSCPVTYSEKEAWKRSRSVWGGNVGFEAISRSLGKPTRTMKNRIQRYHLKYS